MSKNQLLMVGSSWHASVVVDAIEIGREFQIVGYLDDTLPIGTDRRGYPVLGGIGDAAKICTEHAITNLVLAIGDNWQRRRIYEDLARRCSGVAFPVIQHPSSGVARSAHVGQGSVLLAGSRLGPSSRIGEFCIVNTSASLDHDCVMHNFSSVAPGVSTGGLVKIGECSSVGVGASVSDRVSIGSHTVVGTGAVVVRDIADFVVAYGNPATARRSRAADEPYIRSSS